MKSDALKMERATIEVDAANRAVGRVASEVAMILQGKTKPGFVRHLDEGDRVLVINAGRVKFTGRKLEQKDYLRHTMHPGGLKRRAMKHVRDENPGELIRRAVYGMLPKNKLRDQRIMRLKVEV